MHKFLQANWVAAAKPDLKKKSEMKKTKKLL